MSIETNYAVILSGRYGTGKTHLFKEVIAPEIKKIASPSDAKKKYRPIHISLFGFKAIEEIQISIFVSLIPFLKNGKVKLAASIGKMLFRSIAQISRAGDIDKYINDI